jgi:hypothetical protein
MTLSAVLVCVVLALPGQQTSASTTAATSPSNDATDKATTDGDSEAPPEDLPVSLSRIQRALAQPSMIKLQEPRMRDGRPVYRVDVEGEKVNIQTILGKDLLRGAASYGGMTHQEFLDLVTPDDVKGYAAFSNAEGLTVAATSIALKWAVLKALDQLKKAKDARETEAAKKEVDQALEALRKARSAAGLPDK